MKDRFLLWKVEEVQKKDGMKITTKMTVRVTTNRVGKRIRAEKGNGKVERGGVRSPGGGCLQEPMA